MPSTTFQNLPAAKRRQVTAALLTEFSQYSLANAQVARIVKTAGIARGAFYKYFTDLTDAYQYLFQVAIKDIHRPLMKSNQPLAAADYVDQVKAFVSLVNGSPYRDLMRLHYQTNESVLAGEDPRLRPHNGREWGVMVLSHEAIKSCLLQPDEQETVIKRLMEALTALLA